MSSSALSTISFRNEGVPTYPDTDSPAIAATCISVCPVPVGITVQPNATAPFSIIEPAGVKW